MTIAANRASAISVLAFVAVLLVGLAPQGVQAHGHHAHQSVPAEAEPHVGGGDAAGTGVAIASASPSCPAGSDKPCGCGNLVALVRSDTTTVLDSSVRDATAIPPALRAQVPAVIAPPCPAVPHERPAPRAPPLFS
jgi:hypothetical protein